MIDSLHNVDQNFYRELVGENLDQKIAVTTHLGETINVPFVFARKSANDHAETRKESYPVISITNYLPKLNNDFHNPYDKELVNRRDTDNDGKEDTADLVSRPVPLIFRYDVAIAVKTEAQSDALRQYFFQRFGFEGQNVFTFNKILLPLAEPIGDIVDYSFDFNEPYRTDGIFETIFTFNLNAWVHLKLPQVVELSSGITLDLNQVNND